jgi:UDP-N-acetylglucosamine transferase subunit ALG13
MPETYTVFASIGNGELPFSRFADWLRQALAVTGVGPCLFQTGHTAAGPGPWTGVPFLEPQEFQRRIREARYVVIHGGSGSVFSALRYGKCPLVVPRLPEWGEIIDGHQRQLLDAVGRAGWLIPIWSVPELVEGLRLTPPERPAISGGNLALVERLHHLVQQSAGSGVPEAPLHQDPGSRFAAWGKQAP